MATREYSKSIADSIREFLENDGWRFSFDDDKGTFHFGLNLSGSLKKTNYLINVKEDRYLVYAISPIGAAEDDDAMMANMAEFICRANYGLIDGNFELDVRDGEIRFKSFVNCDGVMPSTEIIKESIYCPAAMFERYSMGITGIIFGGLNAKEAIDKCE